MIKSSEISYRYMETRQRKRFSPCLTPINTHNFHLIHSYFACLWLLHRLAYIRIIICIIWTSLLWCQRTCRISKTGGHSTLFNKIFLIRNVFWYLQTNNEDNTKLLKAINADGRIHMVPSVVKGNYFLRFVVCASRTTSEDIQKAWTVIQEITNREFL